VNYAQHLLARIGDTVDLPNPADARRSESGKESPADRAVAEWFRVEMFWPWMLGLNGAAGLVLVVAVWVAAFS
jgi:hypothetical protein